MNSKPFPVMLALILNQLRSERFKRIVQTVTYLPHFISTVVLAGMLYIFLSPTCGIVNVARGWFGGEAMDFMSMPGAFRTLYIISGIWQGAGYSTILYIATLTGIDPSMYEAAEIDGASRLQKAWHVTIPGIIPIIIIQYIMTIGRILNAGFDQVFNLMNDKVLGVADIIDTYVYRIGLQEMKYDLSTAVGLFKNVVGVILIVGSNAIISRYSEYGIW